MSRRGKCSKIFTDNATNFVGANSQLKAFYKTLNFPDQILAAYFTEEGIEWNFIPPRAPHMGGLWEVGIKSVKYHLKRALGSSRLTYEEFEAVIIQQPSVEIKGVLSTSSSGFLRANTEGQLHIISHVKHFTYIIAARHGDRGFHIHLPEFVIGHDDYILFCHQHSVPLQYVVHGNGLYTLDILQNMVLAGSGKPDTSAYRPMEMIYVDEKETCSIDFRKNLLEELTRLKKSFKRVKHNTDSYFRKFLFLDKQQAKQHLLGFMMPVVTPFPPLYKLSYSTLISNTPSESCQVEDVVTFSYKRTNDVGYISKGKQLLFDGSHFLKTSHYLRFNAFLMATLKTNNAALKRWYQRALRMHPKTLHINFIFDKINQILRENNTNFLDDPIPSKPPFMHCVNI
ncbi:SF3 helicase domain-containing protein [Trichonephila clavipes]|nr:SF3 helicase domain-containing protein [Trichonephila clavipes]